MKLEEKCPFQRSLCWQWNDI